MPIQSRFSSAYGRAFMVLALVFLLLWPLARVESLVQEREGLQTEARAGIAAIHGGAQTIGGPLLKVPTEVLIDEWNAEEKRQISRWVAGEPRWLLPESLAISTAHQVKTEVRGIYSLAVYTLPDLKIRGEFPAGALSRLIPDAARERALWSRATLFIPFGSLASLQAVARSDFAGRRLLLGSGDYFGQPGLVAPLDLTERVAGGSLPFHFAFQAKGSEALRFLPMAGATQVQVRSAWPHPSFDGPFAADHSTPGAQGFTASWNVLEINRELPRSWSGGAVDGESLMRHAFGFSMLTPIDVYSMSYRATRYGVLFIVVTFLAFFAWEQTTSDVRLHGMNYLLVGLALAVFFLMLLAIGEHLPFATAYALAAGALVLLLGVYVAGVTGRRLAALFMSLGIASCYSALYLILQSEDYALLLGSLLVFALLSITMLATRRLDWYAMRS